MLWQLLYTFACMPSLLCYRCTRSWSGRPQTRAGLFLEDTQTSLGSTTRCVWMCGCMEIVGCPKFQFQHKLSLVITCPCLQALFFRLSFVFDCTVEVIRATQRSLLFPYSKSLVVSIGMLEFAEGKNVK